MSWFSGQAREILEPLHISEQLLPLDAKLSFVPAAMKVGLRSEIGLALMILPPTACRIRQIHVPDMGTK